MYTICKAYDLIQTNRERETEREEASYVNPDNTNGQSLEAFLPPPSLLIFLFPTRKTLGILCAPFLLSQQGKPWILKIKVIFFVVVNGGSSKINDPLGQRVITVAGERTNLARLRGSRGLTRHSGG